VQDPRDQLLAGAGLAFDEHGRIRRGDPLEHREHLADREAVADQLPEPARLAGRQIEWLGLGLDAQHRAADRQCRSGGHGDLSDPRALVPGPVGRPEVAHGEPRGLAAQREVARRDPIVGQNQATCRAGADLDLSLAQPARPAAIGAVDDHDLTAQPAGAAVEDVAVHCRAPRHAS
jgi:hypothetical protein